MKTAIFFLMGLLFASPVHATESGPPLTISLFNQSWAFPLTQVFRVNGPLYPGITVGTEFTWKQSAKHQWVQSLEAGGYLNRSTGSAMFLETEFRYRRIFKNGIQPEAGIGLGYFHNFSPSPLFQQQEDGQYQSISDSGKPGSEISLSLGCGYQLPTELPATVFVRYQWMAASPYTDIIPIRPTGLLHLGLRFTLTSQSS